MTMPSTLATLESTPSETSRSLPDPEVLERASRRRFTATYKLRILQEADAAKESKQVGALLRREGLHSSHVVAWRRLREEGVLSALGQPHGRKPADPAATELTKLQQQNAALLRRLAVSEAMIAIQKKVSRLLGIALDEPEVRPC